MQKTILITGSTDGIGLETAKMLVEAGHHVLLHGRNRSKLDDTQSALTALPGGGRVESYLADLSLMADVAVFANTIADKHADLDVLINNAGIYNTPDPMTQDGLDVRFAVNTFAPYLLTQRLLPIFGTKGRVINLSSASQAPIDLDALTGQAGLHDRAAYGQSKLAITMWSHSLGLSLKDEGPVVVAVNPGSLLGSKMVKQAFGIDGGDIRIGAEILVRAALSDEFETASGAYFDNDAGRFAPPHRDALDREKAGELIKTMDAILEKTLT